MTMARMSSGRAAEAVTEVESRYRALLDEHARSGLTQKDFTAKKGMPAITLSWWRHEITHRDRLRAQRNGKERPAAATVLPVQFVAATLARSGPTKSDPDGRSFVSVR